MDENISEFQLRINTGDKASEVFVLDSQFHLIAKGIGDGTEFNLTEGLYIVKVKSGAATNEKPIALTKDTFISFDPLQLLSPIPLENALYTNELKFQTFSDYCIRDKNDNILGTGSKLFLFGSIPKNLLSSERPTLNTKPALGLTLRNFKDEVLIDFGDPKIETYNWADEPWVACDVDLDPGNYVLCVETEDGISYKQSIVTCATWQTQVFLQPRNYGTNNRDIRADLFNSAVMMSKVDYGFNPKEGGSFNDGTNYRLTEQIRQAFKANRNTVNRDLLQTLLSEKFDNPMLGLYSAHMLLRNPDVSFSDLRIIISNLRKILGHSHPDVEAIALKVGIHTDFIFHEFPMFASSWNFVLEKSFKDTTLIPYNSEPYRLSGQFWSNECWLIWGNDRKIEDQSVKQELVTMLQQDIQEDTSKYFTNTISQVAGTIASNNNIEQKITKHLPSYQNDTDNGMTNVTPHYISQITQNLGIPRQKVSDIIERINIDDLKSSVTSLYINLSSDSDDPQKGKWGGKAKSNFRKMTASVLNSTIPGLYKISITVSSTKKDIPLEGKVKFHLHDTFLNPTPIVPIEKGKATLDLSGVWGSFTIGAELDNGKTQLELDLSELPNAPKEFKDK